ncbi:MAG: glycosyltransferase [Betaproteobacteria bacterium]|nr:MAG: glycosyltransferase [Betaproteobacteria bacterium]
MLYATTACARPSPLLTIVIPALNEGSVIAELLASLAPLRVRGVEVVVVDGGSTDGTAAAAGPGADRVLVAPCGRARQMNAGAAAAHAPVLLFLHADTRLPANADQLIVNGLGAAGLEWGRFDAFAALGGFPDQALMEDVELSSRLKRRGPPLCLRPPVVTSGRRWNARGVARTILLMWWIRLLYVFGVAPDRLARMYH